MHEVYDNSKEECILKRLEKKNNTGKTIGVSVYASESGKSNTAGTCGGKTNSGKVCGDKSNDANKGC